jgi:hypothetical protein
MTAFLPSITSLLFMAGGLIVGAMGYRYYLKRDPAKLEALAQKLKQIGEKV